MAQYDFEIHVVEERGGEQRPDRSVAQGYIDEKPFLLIVVTPRTYTLSWAGQFNFQRLERELFHELPLVLWHNAPRWAARFLPFRIFGSAALVTANRDSEDEPFSLRRFEKIGSPEYRSVLRNQRIAFARYDLKFWSGLFGHRTYSFTAANPEYYSESSTLALQLQRRHPPTAELFSWLFDRSKFMRENNLRLDPHVVEKQTGLFLRETGLHA